MFLYIYLSLVLLKFMGWWNDIERVCSANSEDYSHPHCCLFGKQDQRHLWSILFFVISAPWSYLVILNILFMGSISTGPSPTWQAAKTQAMSPMSSKSKRKLKAVTCLWGPLVVCSAVSILYPIVCGFWTCDKEWSRENMKEEDDSFLARDGWRWCQCQCQVFQQTICQGGFLFHHRIHCDRIWIWMDIVRGKTEQAPQSELLQLVLLCSTHVKERRHNIGYCSKEGVADRKRQDRVEDRNRWSYHPDKLGETNSWSTFTFTSPRSPRPRNLSWLSEGYSASFVLSLADLYLGQKYSFCWF